MNLPEAGTAISIVEVAPRDGLQNESQVLPASTRAHFVERLADAGLKRIEAGSFVNPKWIPAMAGSADLFRLVEVPEGVRLSALTPNLRGYDDAVAAGVREVAVFLSASETHNKKNTNCSSAESIERFRPIIERAAAAGIPVRGYVSVVVGCPYEGDVAPERVVALGSQLLEMGCYELSLGDTIGVGTPRQVNALLEAFAAAGVPMSRLALHLHDTRGMAIANVVAGLCAGVRTFDASAGGLGGCPYAPGATGNLATEDLVYLLDGLGLDCGVDLESLGAVSAWMGEILNKAPASRVWSTLAAAKES